MTLQQHLDQYKRDGYTVFPGYLSVDQVAQWRLALDPEFDRLFAQRLDKPRSKIVPLLAHEGLAPLATGHLVNPQMLDFAELVMGPFVQLDSFEVSGFPIREPELGGHVDLWHRDAFYITETWSHYPLTYEQQPRPYTPPLACNCLTYLQEMTPQSGPLRVVPGSHLDYTKIPEEEQHQPHPREQLLSLKAGDMVFTHHELLHSGTWNISDEYRYFLSIYICRIGLPHRDPFDLPAIHRILGEARSRNDRRILRLFGEDDRFMAREESAWRRLVDEDRQALGG